MHSYTDKFFDSWQELEFKNKINCLLWSTSMNCTCSFKMIWSFQLSVCLWMNSTMPVSLNPNKKEKHALRLNWQVEHPTRSHQLTLTSQDTLLIRSYQINTMEKITLRNTRGNIANNPLPINGVITTIHHDMIHLNSMLRGHIWKKCLPPTCPTKPW